MIGNLRDDFMPIREQNKVKEKAARIARALAKKAAAQANVEEEIDSDVDGEQSEVESDGLGQENKMTGIRLRINLK